MMKHLLYVYGTLKKGHTRQKYLLEQRYLGTATLKPTHRMVQVSGYPALIPPQEGVEGSKIRGELYEVSEDCIQTLDKVEGVDHGLFKRVSLVLESHVPVMLPTDPQIYSLLEKGEVQAYVYGKDASHAKDVGCFWF
jgi:gamma-glutamylaminecyclotransferase